jgi:hypothetical protein
MQAAAGGTKREEHAGSQGGDRAGGGEGDDDDDDDEDEGDDDYEPKPKRKHTKGRRKAAKEEVEDDDDGAEGNGADGQDGDEEAVRDVCGSFIFVTGASSYSRQDDGSGKIDRKSEAIATLLEKYISLGLHLVPDNNRDTKKQWKTLVDEMKT